MENAVSDICRELKNVANESREAFGSLTAEQLNWKPDAKSWSVAQCFDHLITTHSLYFPLFDRLIAGDKQTTFWEKYSPLSGFFGRFLIKGLDPNNKKKMKTTGKAFPSSSEIGADIIERFGEHQEEMARYVERLPLDPKWNELMITSPLLGFVTYSLDDAMTFVPMHCRRHFDQAKRVTEAAGFPV